MGPGPGRAGVRTWAEPVMQRFPWRGRSREPDRLDHGVEDLVGRHLVGQGLVREHEPMAEDILRQVADVLRQRVRAAADRSASARAPCTRLIEPRGLAPYATKRSRSARPCSPGGASQA